MDESAEAVSAVHVRRVGGWLRDSAWERGWALIEGSMRSVVVVTQQARILAISGQLQRYSHLIRDRDSKFTDRFDAVFASEGVRTILTPVRTPVANAYAERFVRTIRRECLD